MHGGRGRGGGGRGDWGGRCGDGAAAGRGKGGEGGSEGEKVGGSGRGNVTSGSAPRAVLLTANVCFADGPGAQLNVAFSETSASLRQDDTLPAAASPRASHSFVDGGGNTAPGGGSSSTSDQFLPDNWISPHWKTPLPTHLPASLPPLPPKPLYGVPHYIHADLYSTPLPEHPNKRLETQNKEVFSGYLAGVPKAQHSSYAAWALPRGVVVALPSPFERVLSHEGGRGEEFWLVVTYVRGGGRAVECGGCEGSEERSGLEVGEGKMELGEGLADTGYMAEDDWKVQQVVIAYDADGQLAYVKHTRFL
ncbi:hypothetical protein CLOP_g23742 [Closterium sp. NIES-67]|nr:hypothetical protein CLOP_g23742 [Closterium sp. NIES-67]